MVGLCFGGLKVLPQLLDLIQAARKTVILRDMYTNSILKFDDIIYNCVTRFVQAIFKIR